MVKDDSGAFCGMLDHDAVIAGQIGFTLVQIRYPATRLVPH